MTALSGWCGLRGRPDCAGCERHGQAADCGCVGCGNRLALSQSECAAWDNGATSKDGPGDPLFAQRVEVPGPRPTLIGAPN